MLTIPAGGLQWPPVYFWKMDDLDKNHRGRIDDHGASLFPSAQAEPAS